MFEHLSAKSWNTERDGEPPRHVFLPGHLYDVWSAAKAVIDATGKSQLSAFGLSHDKWLERFRRVVLLAAVVHDIGKANDQFIGMITYDRKYRSRRQGFRHEWISWLILQSDSWKKWLLPSLCPQDREVDWQVAVWAITGHHPAYRRECPPSSIAEGSFFEMQVFLGHREFADCLDVIQKCLKLEPEDRPVCNDLPLKLSQVANDIAAWTSTQQLAWDGMQESRDRSSLCGFVAAVKNCLVAADVAGSALWEHATGQEVGFAIKTGFARLPSKDDFTELIEDRLTDKATGVVHELRPFQRKVADLASDVTLVTAGCGTGKTVAAYHWAGENHPNRRLYICYPTTGTATEGYRDYVFDSAALKSKFGARLFHGRSDIDQQLILGVYNRDEGSGSDLLERVDALAAWSTPIVVCTVDTVLGIMQNHRRGLYAWPALAGGAFVFDEIHAFDASLFGALLRFIRELRGVPILLMTASLPSERLERLREAVEHRNSQLVEIDGPRELETLDRYHRYEVSDIDQIVDCVRLQLQSDKKDKKKVLWVTNTVARAMKSAERCHGLQPIVYHSRFKYDDRVKHHKRVIEQFGDRTKPALVICTQVAEMSLDLSADLLVTELAPIPSLIQRLGRLNRRAKSEDDPSCPFIVYEPQNKGIFAPLPYEAEQLEQARQWLAQLPKSISQRHLVEEWRNLELNNDEQIYFDSTWLDGGFRREVKELRAASNGITVVMEEDAKRVFAKEVELAEVVIPMTPPHGKEWREWSNCFGVPVAPSDRIEYCAAKGAAWIVRENA